MLKQTHTLSLSAIIHGKKSVTSNETSNSAFTTLHNYKIVQNHHRCSQYCHGERMFGMWTTASALARSIFAPFEWMNERAKTKTQKMGKNHEKSESQTHLLQKYAVNAEKNRKNGKRENKHILLLSLPLLLLGRCAVKCSVQLKIESFTRIVHCL